MRQHWELWCDFFEPRSGDIANLAFDVAATRLE
jgi:hypothetical protein